MFLQRNASHCQPMVVSYYDESIDQDVLRVVKQIRQRSGVTPINEMKNGTAPSSRRVDRRKEQLLQSLPKYNVEVQTDSYVLNNDKPLVPAISITRKFPQKGHQDEFDYVDYKYNDEPEVRPMKPTMAKIRTYTSNSVQLPTSKNLQSNRPSKLKLPPMVDTNIASLVKPYDSPTRHINGIESTTMTTQSDSFWAEFDSSDDNDSFDDRNRDVMTPVSLQPYSFVCSAAPNRKVHEKKPVSQKPEILASFTEITDNDTLDLSTYDRNYDKKINSRSDSFWGRIVNSIVGVVVPEGYSDDEPDETVILKARAKYEDFFDSIASPESVLPLSPPNRKKSNDKFHNRYDPEITTRSQLPPHIRSNLINDFLNHMLGREKDDEYRYSPPENNVYNRQYQKTPIRQKNDVHAVQLYSAETKPANHLPKKGVTEVNLRKVSESVVYHKPSQAYNMGPVSSRRSRSRLHDIVDNIMERVASKNKTVGARLFENRPNPPKGYVVDDDKDECDDDASSNFITEISIPNTRMGLSTNYVSSSTDDHSITSTMISTYSRSETKRTVSRTMAIWDDATTDNDDDSYSSGTSESSIFSSTFAATSFTFE